MAKSIKTYQPPEPEPRYARWVGMEEIENNDYKLNISRYISMASADADADAEIDVQAMNAELVTLEQTIRTARGKHNALLKEPGLPPLV